MEIEVFFIIAHFLVDTGFSCEKNYIGSLDVVPSRCWSLVGRISFGYRWRGSVKFYPLVIASFGLRPAAQLFLDDNRLLNSQFSTWFSTRTAAQDQGEYYAEIKETIHPSADVTQDP